MLVALSTTLVLCCCLTVRCLLRPSKRQLTSKGDDEGERHKTVNINLRLQREEEQAALNLKWYVYKRATTQKTRLLTGPISQLTLEDLQSIWLGLGDQTQDATHMLKGDPSECGILKVWEVCAFTYFRQCKRKDYEVCVSLARS